MNAIEQLIDRLAPHRPDFSDFTVVAMSGRGRDLLHDTLHRNLGGLMPTLLNFDDYKSLLISGRLSGIKLAHEEALVRFHALLKRERGVSPPPEDAERLLRFLSLIVKYSVRMNDFTRAERLPDEQVGRIEGFFSLMQTFRTELAGTDRFYAPFEEDIFADTQPRDNDLFVGLPLMTPVNEQFFSRIPDDNYFTDAPLFGSSLIDSKPDYESALTLVRRLNLPERSDNIPELSFSELTDQSAIIALVSGTISNFLAARTDPKDQLLIVLLDESLSFYLWERVFRPLGDQANFALWLSFRHFGVAHRLLDAIRRNDPLFDLRREIARELVDHWHQLDPANRAAGEKAITLIDLLTELRPLMGKDRQILASHLVINAKLYLSGRRDAPVQVVPLGEATGVPYSRTLVLPMDRDVFPDKPFDGPFLNLVHLPRIQRAMFEADDLALRQFLAFGTKAHIAARYDTAAGMAPSPHFAFLSTEFDKKPARQRMAATPLRTPGNPPVITNDENLRDWLRQYNWSFSSLALFLTCPYRFLLEKRERITPPAVLEPEESVNLMLGNFIHKFFAALKILLAPLDRWQALFEEQWDADEEIQDKITDQAVRKAILMSYLKEIADHERSIDEPLLFSPQVREAELKLGTKFGARQYRLTGRIDRLQKHAGRWLVADLKYKDKIGTPPRGGLVESIAGDDPLNNFNDCFQLVFYVYLLVSAGRAAAGELDAAFLLLRAGNADRLRSDLPADEIAGQAATMDAVAQRLDKMLEKPEFTPNFSAAGCVWCPFKAICLRPDLYRGGDW